MRVITRIQLLIAASVFLLHADVVRAEKDKQERTKGKQPQVIAKRSIVSGHHKFHFKYDGLDREYLVYVPPTYNPERKTPVVLALHGGGGDEDKSPRFFQIEKKAKEERFLVVYPQATGRVDRWSGDIRGEWNSGIPEKKITADDVGYFSEMIDRLREDFNVDEKRIHAMGHSQGATMSHRLACELNSKIASVAAGGSHGTRFPPSCRLTRPISIFHFHGMQDPCSPYAGGMCGCPIFGKKNAWACRSLENYITDWRRLNECKMSSVVTYQNKSATCVTNTKCRGGIEVTLCKIGDLGHTWPGNDYGIKACDRPNALVCRAWKKLVGPINYDLNGNEMIWEFFKRHPMR